MIRSNTLFGLVVVTVLVAVGAVWVRYERGASRGPAERGQPLVKGLADELNDVRTIDLLTAEGHFQVKGEGDTWIVPAKGGYPAKQETVRSLLFGLANMEIEELMTADPSKYERLGVEDLGGDGAGPGGDDGADATARDAAGGDTATEAPDAEAPSTSLAKRVRLLDGEGRVLASVVLGHRRPTGEGQYVRKPDEQQSYLVSEAVEVPLDPLGWVDKVLMRLDVSRIKRVVVQHPDGEQVTVQRRDDDDGFVIGDVPPGKVPKSDNEARRLAGLLSYVTFDDVASLADVDVERDDAVKTVYQTLDGMQVVVVTVPAEGDEGGRHHARFRVTAVGETDAVADSVEQEAAELDERLSRFAFLLPDYKANDLRRRLDELLKDAPAPRPDETDDAPAAAPDGAGDGDDPGVPETPGDDGPGDGSAPGDGAPRDG